jgi:hypothetical protein
MNYDQYIALFDDILIGKNPDPHYSDPKYLNYAKLNQARMNRWQKNLQLNSELVTEIKKITQSQEWIIIAEHWCGDAAPIVPFLVRLASQNTLIRYDIQLRDQEPFLINSYLTNGTKSIPKLIVRDERGKDLFTWGPRPVAAANYMNELKMSGIEMERVKLELQNWYNENKGEALQKELLQLFTTFNTEN